MNYLYTLLIPLLIIAAVAAVIGFAKLLFFYLLLDCLGLTIGLSSGETICLVIFIFIIYKLSKK